MSALDRLCLPHLKHVEGGEVSDAQAQTRDSFGFKWGLRHTYESEASQNAIRQWLIERYLGGDPDRMKEYLDKPGKLILDAGCGAGNPAILLFGDRLRDHDYLGVDISSAVDVARDRFATLALPGDFLRVDLMNLPVPDGSLDIMFSEGVLHHTDSTRDAVMALERKLAPGGLMMFYVYRKKALVREFTDDAIREQLRPMSDEQAWEALKPLTRLGIALGKLDCEIDVPEDIPLLGISKGKLDIQRFFYWNICKTYFRPEFNVDEMNHINFDWFRPLNCHRHTEEEVRSWCGELGMTIVDLNVQESGITVIARKR